MWGGIESGTSSNQLVVLKKKGARGVEWHSLVSRLDRLYGRIRRAQTLFLRVLEASVLGFIVLFNHNYLGARVFQIQEGIVVYPQEDELGCIVFLRRHIALPNSITCLGDL